MGGKNPEKLLDIFEGRVVGIDLTLEICYL
jgi:hypothetical protein